MLEDTARHQDPDGGKRSERETPELYSQLAIAYGRIGDVARAELSTAEAAMLTWATGSSPMQRAESALRPVQDRQPGMAAR